MPGRFLVLSVVLAVCADVSRGNNLDAWVLSALDRAKISDTAGAKQTAELFAARGEFEGFQIVVRSRSGPIRAMKISVSDLIQSNSRKIDKRNITIYKEMFVQVRNASPDWQGSNSSQGAGRYPDILVPLNTSGDMNENSGILAASGAANLQPLWLDVFVPRDAKPGVYQGEVTISAKNDSVTVPVKLTVWNFELPLKPSLKTSFGHDASGRAGMEVLLRHKLMPLRATANNCANGCAAEEKVLIDRFGLASTDTGFWSGADRSTCKLRKAPSAEAFARAARGHAPGLFLYNYTADEVDSCAGIDNDLKLWSRNMQGSGIKNLVVMAPKPELFDNGSGKSAVDIWVVLPKMFDTSRANIDQVLARGHEVWSYNTLSQDGYSPKWLIDYDLVNYRIQPGFMNQSLGLTGLMYWKADNWSKAAWDEVNNYGVFSAANYPGEGILVYSSPRLSAGTVLPSIRLKALRDGVEDYEYVALLKQRGRGAWAMSTVQTVARDWKNWSRSGVVLEKTRRILGEELDRLAGNSSPTSFAKPARSAGGR